ncbi:MAG: CCA tRNA nucleotidyltransferase [Agathobacter sp.]|nr:CCA tRNA nucleotidyltransferase [Agathobacter sp.]
MEIIYEDDAIIVCYKPAGVPTQTKRLGQQDMESLLKNYRVRNHEQPYIGVVHRLDQPVEGVMVFAKTPQAAADLSAQVQKRTIGKCYLALGIRDEGAKMLTKGQSGSLTDFLVFSQKENLSRIITEQQAKSAGAKKAMLDYEIMDVRSLDGQTAALFDITLHTGRHHQIRAQLSHLGYPLYGDQKYGNAAGKTALALCSYRIAFSHPVTGKEMDFVIEPQHPLLQRSRMNMQLPADVENIIQTLENAGFEGYAVGGCVRDTLLGRVPKDWDITTSAKPQEVKALFSHTIDTGIQHGTVTVMQNHVGYEVTTYRIDGEYEDARHPKEVTFTSSLAEDLRRRDFTINAMAYSHSTGLVDLFDGEKDLREHRIRCVGNATERFSEDALRMLRAIRFSAQLGFEIEQETCDAIRELAGSIRKISAERIATELIKTVTSAHPDYLEKAYKLGLTAYVLPEFDAMMQCPQMNRNHCFDVGTHSLAGMQQIQPEKDLRLAMLFHDVAKPLCKSTDETGQEHYYGHPEMGAEMTKKILRRLKLDNDTIAHTTALVRYHDERPELTDRALRQFLNQIGVELLPDLIAIKRADILAQSEYLRKEKLEYLSQLESLCAGILARNECVSLAGLAVNGKDLLALGIPQGKQIGAILKYLLMIVLDHPAENTKEHLMEMAERYEKNLEE